MVGGTALAHILHHILDELRSALGAVVFFDYFHRAKFQDDGQGVITSSQAAEPRKSACSNYAFLPGQVRLVPGQAGGNEWQLGGAEMQKSLPFWE